MIAKRNVVSVTLYTFDPILNHRVVVMRTTTRNVGITTRIVWKETTSIELRYLKKMLKVPQATPNSFVYLETGILPIDHEIYRRQCGFLHHILNLEEGDPVKLLYTHMRNLPDQQNWANTIYKTRLGYGIDVMVTTKLKPCR